MSCDTRILLAHNATQACFQVRGRGNFHCSGRLQRAIRHLRAAGCRTFAFDLRDCPAMDSTFIGVMVGPLRKVPGLPGGDEPCQVIVCRANQRVRDTLEEMGIAPRITFAEECPAPAEFAPAEAPEGNPADLARASMEAHQNLISLNPEKNADRFRDVVAFLAEEVDRHSSSESSRD